MSSLPTVLRGKAQDFLQGVDNLDVKEMTVLPVPNATTQADIDSHYGLSDGGKSELEEPGYRREMKTLDNSATLVNATGNSSNTINVNIHTLTFGSSAVCPALDVFGCAEVDVALKQGATISSFALGMNLQSQKQLVTDKNGHTSTQNVASSAELVLTWACLQTASSYMPLLNSTFNALVSAIQNPGLSPLLPCSATTSPLHGMYLQVQTSSIPFQLCSLMLQIANNVEAQCVNQSQQQILKTSLALLGLLALAVLVVIPVYMGYSKCTKGRFFSKPECMGGSSAQTRDPFYNSGNVLPSQSGPSYA